jgi:hypothetical protein
LTILFSNVGGHVVISQLSEAEHVCLAALFVEFIHVYEPLGKGCSPEAVARPAESLLNRLLVDILIHLENKGQAFLDILQTTSTANT